MTDSPPQGYYRFPTIHDDYVVFACEGDLWSVPAGGGVARRLTSNPGRASVPALSPDGELLAFSGRDEGHTEVYCMPALGGPSERLTHLGAESRVVGWHPSGQQILFASNVAQPFAKSFELYGVADTGGEPARLPTGPAMSISYGLDGGAVIGRNTTDIARWKRYRGGLTGDLWIDVDGSGEWARLLELDGNVAMPLWIGDRIYFVSDHEGIGNLYSCSLAGDDVRRHTHHEDYYVRHPATDGKRIVYHAGADLYLLEPTTDASSLIEIDYRSPRAKTKRKFVSASKYLQGYSVHPEGHSVAVTARGRTFTMAAWEGAVVQHGEPDGVRYRLAEWLADGRRLVVVSDRLGEETLEVHDASGESEPIALEDLDIGRPLSLRAAPQGNLVALTNHRHQLLLVDVEQGRLRVLDHSRFDQIYGVAWSPDARWLAYGFAETMQTSVIRLCEVESGTVHDATRPVLHDVGPSFDPDGKYLYFISYRDFNPVYDSMHFDLNFPRGARPFLITLQRDEPSPFVPKPHAPGEKPKGEEGDGDGKDEDKNEDEDQDDGDPEAEPEDTESSDEDEDEGEDEDEEDERGNEGEDSPQDVAAGGSDAGGSVAQSAWASHSMRSSWEVVPRSAAGQSEYGHGPEASADAPAKVSGDEESGGKDESDKSGKGGDDKGGDDKKPIVIDLEGIADRVLAFPVPEARYGQVRGIPGKAVFTSFPIAVALHSDGWYDPTSGYLETYSFDDQKLSTVVRGVGSFEVTPSGKTLIYRSGGNLRLLKAGEKPASEGPPSRRSGWLDLSRIRISVKPSREWEQMFREAWRLQRDHFWSEDMSGVDWQLVYRRYFPLVARIASRAEFSDLMWEMQGELGTSHAYEFGGDYPSEPAYTQGLLGADLAYDAEAKGYRVTHIVRGDTWNSRSASPLVLPGIDVREGDLIVALGGRKVGPDLSPAQLLVNQAGNEVMLTVRRDSDDAEEESTRTVTVKTLRSESPGRYREWVENNRSQVHEATDGRVGYVHVPDMGPAGYAEFHRGFLAEVDREGLIVDARFNGGGHVSQLILEKLARRRLGYDARRWGEPIPYPYESVLGPIVGLANEQAGSDGDIFTHAFKMMEIGPLIGKRTWGGVVGINMRNSLVDGGMTTQPEFSFWFQDVHWGLENYGTEPDIEVEIRPQDHVADNDPQLQRAIEVILDLMKENPPELPEFGERPRRDLPTLPET